MTMTMMNPRKVTVELDLLGLSRDPQVPIDWSQERVYLAGPIKGIPKFNSPLFKEAAIALRARGCVVFSPIEQNFTLFPEFDLDEDGDETLVKFDRRVAIDHGLNWICMRATAVAVLPGWENSKGAMAEVMLARALDLKVMTIEEALGA